MPYKTGKMKGELTTPEIRKLIKAHNVLVSIKIPKASKREDIIALVKKNGYMVDHEKQALIPKVLMKRKPKVDMETAAKVLPKPKTKEEKASAKKVRDKKKKDKEDTIKAEGVKQGAALQRVIAKKKANLEKLRNKVYSPKEIKEVFIYIMEEYEEFKNDRRISFNNKNDKMKEQKDLTIIRNIIKSIKNDKKINDKQLPLVRKAIKFYINELLDTDGLDKEEDPTILQYGRVALDLQKKYK